MFFLCVEIKPLEPGNPANVIPGTRTIEVDPAQATYVDLLHESRHLGQIRALELAEKPVLMTRAAKAIYESDAYHYEQLAGQRLGASSEYVEWAAERGKSYWTPAVKKAFRSSSSLQFLNNIISW